MLLYLVVCIFVKERTCECRAWSKCFPILTGHVCPRVLMAQVVGIALAFRLPRSSQIHSVASLSKIALTFIHALLAIFAITSLLVTMYRWPSIVPQPYRPGPRIFRAGIWTVHFGIDNEGRDSQRRMANLIRCVYISFSHDVDQLC